MSSCVYALFDPRESGKIRRLNKEKQEGIE